MIRPTNFMAKPRNFDCQHFRCDVLVLIHGFFLNIWHYQNAKQFAMDQRMRLATLGWRIHVFTGIPMPDEEIEHQRAKIKRTIRLRRDRECIFNHRRTWCCGPAASHSG